MGVTLMAVLAAALVPAAAAGAWTPPLALDGLDGVAAVAVDADGIATVAAGGTLPRLAQRAPGGLFGAPVGVAQLAPGPPREARVAAAGHGALAAAWQDGYARIVAVARDPGGVVGAPQVLSPADGAGVDSPQVAVAADGSALVAWLGGLTGGGRGLVYAAYRPPGGVFGAPMALTTTPATYPPSVAMNAAGRAVVAWRRERRTEAVSVDRGRFGRVAVIGRPLLDGRLSVAVAGDGAAVVAWTEQRQTEPLRRTGAVWRTARGTFGPTRLLRSSPRGWTAEAPVAAAGPRGETVVVWIEHHALRHRIVAVRGRRGALTAVRSLATGLPEGLAAAVRASGATTIAWDERTRATTPAVHVATAARGAAFGPSRQVAPPQAAGIPITPTVAPAVASGGRATVLVWTIPSDGLSPPRVLWSAADG